MKKFTIFLTIFLMVILTFISCNKDNPIDVPVVISEESDYEIYENEDDGLTTVGEIHIDTTRATGNSNSDILVNGCIDVWQKITRTKYVHKDSVIDWTNGVFKYDCSGFGNYILLRKYLPNHFNDINVNDTTGGRALASDFYDYFRLILDSATSGENDKWKVFMSVDSLQKGDFLIVRYDDNWRKEYKHYLHQQNKDASVSTGHVMIAWQIGSVNSNNQVDIQVYDCSGSDHSLDTRYYNSKPVAEKILNSYGDMVNSGIGFGKMSYLISTNGHRRPFAYKWKLNTSTNSKPWYNLKEGDDITEGIKYDRLKGIIFARPK